jgi:hypothetical protein
MSIEPELVRKTDDAFRDFDAFTRSLCPTDEETGRFYHIVSALSDATKVNYVTLRRAFEDDDQTLMAWSCRNLLELAIFTKFALCSKQNAAEFAADRLIDGLQIGTSLKKLELYLNPELKVSAFEPIIERFSKQMSFLSDIALLSSRQVRRQIFSETILIRCILWLKSRHKYRLLSKLTVRFGFAE